MRNYTFDGMVFLITGIHPRSIAHSIGLRKKVLVDATLDFEC